MREISNAGRDKATQSGAPTLDQVLFVIMLTGIASAIAACILGFFL